MITTHSSDLEMILAEKLSLCNEEISPESVFLVTWHRIRSPGVYYLMGGTMTGKTTLLAKILLHRDKLTRYHQRQNWWLETRHYSG